MEQAIVGGGDVNAASRQVSDAIAAGRDPQTADRMLNEVTQELVKRGHFPKMVSAFANSNFNDLDLDGDGVIAERELKQIDDSTFYNRNLNGLEHQMVKYMRANFKDMIKAHNDWGFDVSISKKDVAALAAKSRQFAFLKSPGGNHYSLAAAARLDGGKFVPDMLVDFGKQNLKALDLDGNGFVTRLELERVSNSFKWSAGMLPEERRAMNEMNKSLELIQRSHKDTMVFTDKKGLTQQDLEAYRRDQYVNMADIPTTPGDHKMSLTIGGVKREYNVHVPKNYDPKGKPLPVMYFYHYFTGNAEELQKYTGMNDIADRENFIAVYPNAEGWIGNKWRQWNLNNNPSYRVDEVAFARSLMDTVESKLNVDKNRQYIAGYSNGGMLAHELAAKLSDRIAAMACVSGCQNASMPTPAEGVSVLMIHGTQDRLVPIEGRAFTPLFPRMKPLDSSRSFWCTANGTDSYSANRVTNDVICETYSNSRTGAEVKVMTMEGSGHGWPGSGQSIDGNPNRSLNASEEIWRFLASHARTDKRIASR